MSSRQEAQSAYRYCGRDFTIEEMDSIRRLIAADPPLNRAQLSRAVCDELGWLRPDGPACATCLRASHRQAADRRRKDMSCRVAMLRMERDGLIRLPPPLNTNGNGRIKPRPTPAGDPDQPFDLPLAALGQIVVRPVCSPKDSALWNELIERYHYLGYKPLPGAQLRYLVFAIGPEAGTTKDLQLAKSPAGRTKNPQAHRAEPCQPRLLAALGFGAAAWMAAPRDRFIGWNADQRQRNLRLLINNARFLILPWINVKNLASKILALAAKQIKDDWKGQYGFEPVLLETFVEKNRFAGTCYRAANWIHVGQTQGRGKLNKRHIRLEPIKDIYLYPLTKHFRQVLSRVQ